MKELSKAKHVQNTPRTPAKWKRGSGVRAGNPPPQNTSKQAKLTTYFGKKSPKAQDTGARLEGTLEGLQEDKREQNKLPSLQGALSPLLGDLGGLKDHPSEDTGAKKLSRAPVGASEVRGRSSSNKKPDQKKVNKTLESWVQGPNK